MKSFYLIPFLIPAISLDSKESAKQRQIFNDLDASIIALVDKGLMPSRKTLSDKDNGLLDLAAAYDKSQKDIANLLNNATASPFTPLAEFSDADFAAYKEFAKKHPTMAEDFAKISKMKCLVPESLPMLINRSIEREYLDVKATVDAVTAVKDGLSSEKIRDLFMNHLEMADAFLNCEGTLVHTVISATYFARVIDYANELKHDGRLSKSDAKLLAQRAEKISIDKNFIKETMRREYRYGSLVGVNVVLRDFTQKVDDCVVEKNDFLFDLKETISQIHKYYHGLFETIDNNKLATFDTQWFTEYTNVKGKLPHSTAYLSQSLALRSLRPDGKGENTTDDKAIAELRKILKEQPASLRNYVGRVYLGLTHSHYLNNLRALITDRDKLLAEIQNLKK